VVATGGRTCAFFHLCAGIPRRNVSILKWPHHASDFSSSNNEMCRSQWPRGLRSGSSAACLLGSWVRIPPGAWMSVSCECCVMSGRGICDELVPRPEESYRLWCV
jgi:hypothetical protein